MASQTPLLPLQQAAAAGPISSLNPGSPHQLCFPPQRLSAIPLAVSTGRRSLRLLHFRVNAAEGGVAGVEPDLSEDYIEGSEDRTLGQDEDFPYGKADGAHTWHKGDDNLGFIESVSNQIKEAGGPNDNAGQATISWLFLPVIFSGLAFGVQPEYIFLVGALFIFAFIGIEMTKPDKPSNFLYDPTIPDRGYKPRI